MIDGTRVPGAWTKEMKGPIYEAFTGFAEDRQKVRLLAFAALDAGDRPKRLVEILQVEPLDPRDVPARVEELKGLRRGWLDGGGEAPAPEGLDWLAHGWTTHIPAVVPNPYIYPTAAGGVQLEWSFGSWELSAEIDLTTKGAYVFATDTAGAESVEENLDLGAPEGWEALARWVKRYEGASRG
jgi:hypothetical protein